MQKYVLIELPEILPIAEYGKTKKQAIENMLAHGKAALFSD